MQPPPCGTIPVPSFKMNNGKSSKAANPGSAPDRHKYKGYLTTRQPAAVVEAMNRIAKKRNTTVAAILGEVTIKIIEKARGAVATEASASIGQP